MGIGLKLICFCFIFISAVTARLCRRLRIHENRHLLPRSPNCSPDKPHFRIMGGKDADVGEFPWMVTLYEEKIDDPSSKNKYCDGTIISHRYVLTAGHCVYPYTKEKKGTYLLSVKFGEHNIDDYTSSKPIEIYANRVLLHEKYDNSSEDNDVGLVRFDDAVIPFSGAVFPICLPLSCKLTEMDLVGRLMTVAGWGVVQDLPLPVDAMTLQKIDVHVSEPKKCQDAWEGQVNISEGKLCTLGVDGPKQSACQGDSGGPLMMKTGYTSNYFQMGIVSAGSACVPYNPLNKPNIFTRVTSYVLWILDNIEA